MRMATTQYRKRQNPDERHIIEQVKLFFEMVDGYSINFLNWDESLDGEDTVSGIISGWYDEIWDMPWRYGSERQQRLIDEIRYADKHYEDYYDELVGKIVDQYETPLHCCIRAGMDMCFEPSEGVLGFTVGTLREMYPEGIPDWLRSQFEGDIAIAENNKGVWL